MNWRLAERAAGLERTMIRRIFDAAPADAINLGLGQPDLATPPTPRAAAVRAIEAGRTGYTSTGGLPELRRVLAARHPGFADGPGSVCVSVGSQQAMAAVCLALAGPGDEVLVPDPGYPAYPVVASLAGATAVRYPLRAENGFRLRPAELLELVGARTRLVVLCTPSNPTGRTIDATSLGELTRELERRGVPWVSDEIYSELCYDVPFVSPSTLSRGGLVVSSVSKDVAMTGWRVGWVVGPEEVIARIVALQQYLVTCAPAISQHAALASFSPAGEAERREIRERFRARREVLLDGLSGIDGLRTYPSEGAFYVFVDVSRFGDDVDLARRFLEAENVVTIPGRAFGENGRGHLRLSYGVGRSALREATARLRRFLRA